MPSRVPRQRRRSSASAAHPSATPGRLRRWAVAALAGLADAAQRASDGLAPVADARSAAGRARRMLARLREARVAKAPPAVSDEVASGPERGDADIDEERRIISDVLAAAARHVREVMVPRTGVVFLPAGMAVADAVAEIRDLPHSRFPVIDASYDDVVGFVHLRDLLTASDSEGRVGSLAREVHRVPTGKRVLTTLSEMRRERHHLAVVVDEYGGTAGIVTLEDLIEELIGEIHDEYDDEPEPEPAVGEPPADVDGRINLGDFAQRFGFDLPPGPYQTLGGFLMASLGRVPGCGDEVTVEGRRLLVTECEGRRVSRVAVSTPADMASAEPADETAPAGEPAPAGESKIKFTST